MHTVDMLPAPWGSTHAYLRSYLIIFCATFLKQKGHMKAIFLSNFVIHSFRTVEKTGNSAVICEVRLFVLNLAFTSSCCSIYQNEAI